MKVEALALGFKHVESGPLVRSSYHARDQVPAEARRGRDARAAALAANGLAIGG
jgi:lipoic acid synthetase